MGLVRGIEELPKNITDSHNRLNDMSKIIIILLLFCSINSHAQNESVLIAPNLSLDRNIYKFPLEFPRHIGFSIFNATDLKISPTNKYIRIEPGYSFQYRSRSCATFDRNPNISPPLDFLYSATSFDDPVFCDFNRRRHIHRAFIRMGLTINNILGLNNIRMTLSNQFNILNYDVSTFTSLQNSAEVVVFTNNEYLDFSLYPHVSTMWHLNANNIDQIAINIGAYFSIDFNQEYNYGISSGLSF